MPRSICIQPSRNEAKKRISVATLHLAPWQAADLGDGTPIGASQSGTFGPERPEDPLEFIQEPLGPYAVILLPPLACLG